MGAPAAGTYQGTHSPETQAVCCCIISVATQVVGSIHGHFCKVAERQNAFVTQAAMSACGLGNLQMRHCTASLTIVTCFRSVYLMVSG